MKKDATPAPVHTPAQSPAPTPAPAADDRSQGGSYVFDPATGQRTLVQRTAAAVRDAKRVATPVA